LFNAYRFFPEFLISDFALASLSIPSFTITSPSLLSPVLESHPPSAIITHGHFLPYILELIFDANESEHHTVIVVGDFDSTIVAKAKDVVKVVKWADVERAGTTGEPITCVPPSQLFLHLWPCNRY
jgi:long-chain acyl-CoA synthetase